MGATAAALLILLAEASERPMYLALPSSTSFLQLATASSMDTS
jgi:hypothetical protein